MVFFFIWVSKGEESVLLVPRILCWMTLSQLQLGEIWREYFGGGTDVFEERSRICSNKPVKHLP